MDLKKILILPVGFILVHTLYIGCCKCITGNYHREISVLRSHEYSHSNTDTRDTVKVIDTLFTSININFNLVSQKIINPFAQLVNAAYATSCNCSNYIDQGFKYKLDSLVITSNHVFKDIPAGQNISNYFKAVWITNTAVPGLLNTVTVPQLIDSMNTTRLYDNISLLTNPGTMPVKNHQLKYSLHSNGKIYDVTATKIVTWQ